MELRVGSIGSLRGNESEIRVAIIIIRFLHFHEFRIPFLTIMYYVLYRVFHSEPPTPSLSLSPYIAFRRRSQSHTVPFFLKE